MADGGDHFPRGVEIADQLQHVRIAAELVRRPPPGITMPSKSAASISGMIASQTAG